MSIRVQVTNSGETALCIEKLEAVKACADCTFCDCCIKTITEVITHLRAIKILSQEEDTCQK